MDFMWLCSVFVRWMMVSICLEFRMLWRSIMLLCTPLVLNVTACMVRCLYDVVAVTLLDGVGVLLRFVSAGCWVVVVVCLRVKNMSRDGWFCVVGSVGGLCGIVHGVGNAILMRGGACAAELRLMGLVVGSLCISGCVFVVCSFGVFCLLLFVGGFCCCVFP